MVALETETVLREIVAQMTGGAMTATSTETESTWPCAKTVMPHSWPGSLASLWISS